jgi:hypothetical protein
MPKCVKYIGLITCCLQNTYNQTLALFNLKHKVEPSNTAQITGCSYCNN